MNRKFLRSVLPLSLAFLSVGPMRAQGPPDPQAPYTPPAIRFEAAGLSLLDAIKLTLQNDPTIKLRETDVALQQGVVRSQKGIFDSLFRVDGSFERYQSELLESEREDLQKVRDDLKTGIVEATTLTDSLTAAGTLLKDKNQAFNNPDGLNLSNIKDPAVFETMDLLKSQLVLYRDILASPSLTDAAVRNDVMNLREQTIGRNLDAFNSQQDAIAGIPQQLQTSLTNLGSTPKQRWSKDSHLTADVFKLFRNGMTLRPYVDLNYTTQNYVGKKRTEPEFGGLGVEPLSTGEIGFEVVLPLLRGSGHNSVAAAETAAKYDLEASRLELLFQQSQSVLTTIQAYWQARAAATQVEVLRRSVEIQGELATITRALIAANEKPRSEEARVVASSADARSRYEAAQRQLSDARVTLAQVMGVALVDAFSIPLASDAYPQPPTDLQIDPQVYAAFIKEAITKRFDRQAVLKSEASGKALVEGARIDTRPALDLSGKGWGTSVHQSSVDYSNWVFRSGNVALSYERPFGNNTAVGLLEARRASLHRTQIDSADLERLIGLNIIQLAESLKVAAERLRSAEEAVRNYDQTMTDEQARFKSGDSSLLDTILTEQQSTNARLALNAAQQEYASLLATLRHEAGLLLQDGKVDGAQLIVVPPALVRR
jgi:outer membrane protein TolC